MTKKPYQKWFKHNQPWPHSMLALLEFQTNTLGFALGDFLQRNHFDVQPKLEDHDVVHVLTNTGVSVPDEIGMQFLLLGNGKRSAYLYMVLVSGVLFYPKQLPYFLDCYRRGKAAHRFHDLDFLRLLDKPLEQLRFTFAIKS